MKVSPRIRPGRPLYFWRRCSFALLPALLITGSLGFFAISVPSAPPIVGSVVIGSFFGEVVGGTVLLITFRRAEKREEEAGYTTLPPPNEARLSEVDPATGATLREAGQPPLSAAEWRLARVSALEQRRELEELGKAPVLPRGWGRRRGGPPGRRRDRSTR